jgi:hypothetical protein
VRFAGTANDGGYVRHRLAGERLTLPSRQRRRRLLDGRIGDHDVGARGIGLVEVEDLAQQFSP